MTSPEPQSFDRVLSSMCTEPHPAARAAAEEFLATNPGDPGTFPAVAELEERAVDRLGEVVGLAEPTGYVASGGTETNVQAVRAARNLGDADDPVVVAPESAHYSFEKAAELCDVRLRRIPTDEDGRADVDAAVAAVDDETVLVVAVAGSTEYGRVDPVPALADLAADAGALCHVDAAWGGFYLPFTDHEWNFADADVDTMTVDPHKAGQAAVPAGGFLADDPAVLDALAVETPYLERDAQASLTGTRSGAGVASAAAALEALWPEGYREAYEAQQANAERLADAVGDRGYDVVEPSLPLVAVDLPDATFEALRERGWRLARTAAGETRIVCMPHLDGGTVEAFLAALDECRGRVPAGSADDD